MVDSVYTQKYSFAKRNDPSSSSLSMVVPFHSGTSRSGDMNNNYHEEVISPNVSKQKRSRKRSLETLGSGGRSSDELDVVEYPFIPCTMVNLYQKRDCATFYNLRKLQKVVINGTENYLLDGKYFNKWVKHLIVDQEEEDNDDLEREICDLCNRMKAMVSNYEVKASIKVNSSSSSSSRSKRSKTTTVQKKETIQYKPQELTMTTTTVIKEKNKRREEDDNEEEDEYEEDDQYETAMVPTTNDYNNNRKHSSSPSSSSQPIVVNGLSQQISDLCCIVKDSQALLREEQRQKNLLIEQNKDLQTQMIAVTKSLLEERRSIISSTAALGSHSPLLIQQQQQSHHQQQEVDTTLLTLPSSEHVSGTLVVRNVSTATTVPVSTTTSPPPKTTTTTTTNVISRKVNIETSSHKSKKKKNAVSSPPSDNALIDPSLPPRNYFAKLDEATRAFNESKEKNQPPPIVCEEAKELYKRIDAIVRQQISYELRRRVNEQPLDNQALVFDYRSQIVHVLSEGYFSLRYYISLLSMRPLEDISKIYDIRIYLKKTSIITFDENRQHAYIQAFSRNSPEIQFNLNCVMLNIITMKLLHTFEVTKTVLLEFDEYRAIINDFKVKKEEARTSAEKTAETMAMLELFPYAAEGFTPFFTLKRKPLVKELKVDDSKQGHTKSCKKCDNFVFISHKQGGKVFVENTHFKKSCIFQLKEEILHTFEKDEIVSIYDSWLKRVDAIVAQYNIFFADHGIISQLKEEFPNIPFKASYSDHLFYADGSRFQSPSKTKAKTASDKVTTRTASVASSRTTDQNIHPRLKFFLDGAAPILQFEDRVRALKATFHIHERDHNIQYNDENAYRGIYYEFPVFMYKDEMEHTFLLHQQQQQQQKILQLTNNVNDGDEQEEERRGENEMEVHYNNIVDDHEVQYENYEDHHFDDHHLRSGGEVDEYGNYIDSSQRFSMF